MHVSETTRATLQRARTETQHVNMGMPQQSHFLEAPRALSRFALCPQKGTTGTAEKTASKLLTKFIDFFTFGLQIIYEVLQPALLG